MKNFIYVASLMAAMVPCLSHGQVVAIANPSVNAQAPTADQVANVFLGKSDALPGAASLQPVDQSEGSEAREQFYKSVANRDPSQVKAYWARMIFTGKGKPPPNVASDSEVKRYVASTPGAIGYISKGSLDGSVKVLLTP